MDREKTKQAIEVMQAYVDGAEIEQRPTYTDGIKWSSRGGPRWNWVEHEYRIKPEPREWWIDPDSGHSYGLWADAYPHWVRVREVLK